MFCAIIEILENELEQIHYCTSDVMFYVTFATGASSLLQPQQNASVRVIYGMLFDELN
jgi:hypothetical protein